MVQPNNFVSGILNTLQAYTAPSAICITTPAIAMFQRLGIFLLAVRVTMPLMADSVSVFDVVRFDEQRCESVPDRVASEAPLEVRLDDQPFSVIMRTAGADEDLAAGFLFTESVIADASDVARIETGRTPNIVNVSLAPRRAITIPTLLKQRRQVVMNSSCGMCGRRTL